jgi:metal-responsive CopG/Arc/MetJ family transcriptional regulator
MASNKTKKVLASRLKSTRASVSFPRELYETLEEIAHEKKVSVAWVVREATEKYVADQWPLFSNRGS